MWVPFYQFFIFPSVRCVFFFRGGREKNTFFASLLPPWWKGHVIVVCSLYYTRGESCRLWKVPLFITFVTQVKLAAKRQCVCQRLQLQGWWANYDFQVIIYYHSCYENIAKYASKGEKMSLVAKDAFTSVLVYCQNVDSGKKAMRKVIMCARFVCEKKNVWNLSSWSFQF